MKDKHFGIRLKHLRKLREITQTQAATAVGISYKALQDHESGSWPNQNNQKKYLDFYGCDNRWFLTGVGDPYIKDAGAKIEGGGLEALDREGLWGKTEKQEFEGAHFDVTTFAPDEGLGSAVDKLARILSSGNQVLIRAILSNLEAFSRSADQEDRAVERISRLEADCEKFKKRLEALEESLTPEGPGISKKAATS